MSGVHCIAEQAGALLLAFRFMLQVLPVSPYAPLHRPHRTDELKNDRH